MLNGGQGEYDLIFADPPYYKSPVDVDCVERLLTDDSLAQCLSADGLLVIEESAKNKRGDYDGWKLLDRRCYGGCGILFYQRQASH